VLLGLFGVIESRAAEPITPLWLLGNPSRAASYGARLLLVAGMFGSFFFLTQFVQDVLRFDPLQAGLAFVPMTGALLGMSRLAPRMVPRFGGKQLLVAGLIPVVAGMVWLGHVSTGTGYVPGILIPMLLLGFGMGLAFVPLTMASLTGVPPQDSGAAASMVNVMQQVGGSLGLAILVTIFGTARRSAASHPLPGAGAAEQARYVLVHGMATAFTGAAIFDAVALIAVIVLIRMPRPRPMAAPVVSAE
jgi:predicted MFS family arabinose efflux permease